MPALGRLWRRHPCRFPHFIRGILYTHSVRRVNYGVLDSNDEGYGERGCSIVSKRETLSQSATL